METTNTIQFGTMIMGLLGGLALFLFGMEQMSAALKLVAGDGMRRLLARLTNNRFSGVLAGTLITAVIQSSSVTTVLVVGFISAGLMTLQQSLGVILGANIGTTITAQIIAFKVTKYALALVAIGFGLNFLGRKDTIKQTGAMIMGLGLIFFGMELMSNAAHPLRSYEPFINLMTQMDNPLFGILIGAVFTAIIQSSSASIGIVIVLASQGFISLDAGIALALGANIGTCITAMLAAIGKPREAVQAAMAHVFFKVLGVIVWFFFIPYLANVVRLISPVAEGLSGVAKLGAETPRQIANAHTIFNVINTFVYIWFTGPVARLMQFLLPVKPDRIDTVKPKYLDEILLMTPSLALDGVRLELEHLGKYVLEMLDKSLPIVIHGDEKELQELKDMDDIPDMLQGEIITFLGKLSQKDLTKYQSYLLQDYMEAANYLENIGDTIETNLVDVGEVRNRLKVVISPETEDVLKKLHRKVFEALAQALESLQNSDRALAKKVIKRKAEINSLVDDANNHLSNRLVVDEKNRLALFRIETDIIGYLKRIYYFAKQIAKITRLINGKKNKDESLANE